MPCGCGKTTTTPPIAAARPAPPPRAAAPTVQGSAAGGFILRAPGRLPKRFASQLEAEAENVRVYGGRGEVVSA